MMMVWLSLEQPSSSTVLLVVVFRGVTLMCLLRIPFDYIAYSFEFHQLSFPLSEIKNGGFKDAHVFSLNTVCHAVFHSNTVLRTRFDFFVKFQELRKE
jgi:hypothetical protein